MSETIKLKVPRSVTRDVEIIDRETKEKRTEKETVEFVSQGYHEAELKPNSIIEVKSQRFADWLVREYGLTIIGDENTSGDSGDDDPPSLEDQYPGDFPKREIFIGTGIPFETAKNLSHEQLVAIKGIADKSAEAILEYVANMNGGQSN